MISAHSPWLAAHGKLWYDDKWYRYGWIVWPQALAALLVLWFWAAPSTSRTAQWGVPLDTNARSQQLAALRDASQTDQQSMGRLEAAARGGEMTAQFYMGTLYDPDLKLSKIVAASFDQSADWYSKAAGQGHQAALSNLAMGYSTGKYTRIDYTRACYYALKLQPNAPGNGLNVRGDCYARGLGGTKTDPVQAEVRLQGRGRQRRDAHRAAAFSRADRAEPASGRAPCRPAHARSRAVQSAAAAGQPDAAEATGRFRHTMGRDGLHRGRLLLHGLAAALTTGSRSQRRQAVRRIRPRQLQGIQHLRPGMRVAGHLSRPSISIVLHRRRHDLP